jgi:predicted NACHT family NTPase
MKQPASNQGRTVYFKMDLANYQRLKDRYAQTTCRSMAEYLRKLVLLEPVTVNQRDASVEELIAELSLIRRELARAVEAFELSAKKVSQLASPQQLTPWLQAHQTERAHIAGLIEQIYQHCKKTTYLWLR